MAGHWSFALRRFRVFLFQLEEVAIWALEAENFIRPIYGWVLMAYTSGFGVEGRVGFFVSPVLSGGFRVCFRTTARKTHLRADERCIGVTGWDRSQAICWLAFWLYNYCYSIFPLSIEGIESHEYLTVYLTKQRCPHM